MDENKFWRNKLNDLQAKSDTDAKIAQKKQEYIDTLEKKFQDLCEKANVDPLMHSSTPLNINKKYLEYSQKKLRASSQISKSLGISEFSRLELKSPSALKNLPSVHNQFPTIIENPENKLMTIEPLVNNGNKSAHSSPSKNMRSLDGIRNLSKPKNILNPLYNIDDAPVIIFKSELLTIKD